MEGRKGRQGKGKGESGRGEKVGKGEKGLDLDSCPGAPEFLVTLLGAEYWDERVCESVRCLRRYLRYHTHAGTSANFLCVLSPAVARSSMAA